MIIFYLVTWFIRYTRHIVVSAITVGSLQIVCIPFDPTP